MNKVILIGNLTRDVELSTTPNGTSIAKFTIAVNRNFTNAAGEREADYPNIIAWRDLADRCAQYLSKGKKVCVCGMLQTRSYEANDGSKRYVTEVVANEVEFLTPKSEEKSEPRQSTQRPAQNRRRQIDDLEPIDDDLPF